MKNILFGAGMVGRRVLSIWKRYSLQVDYFIDNNTDMHQKSIQGLRVYPVSKLAEEKEDYKVYVTCRNSKEMCMQLLEAGVPRENILEMGQLCDAFNFIWENVVEEPQEASNTNMESTTFFDLNNGIVLGGVENWSVRTARHLAEIGKKVELVSKDLKRYDINDLKVNYFEMDKENIYEDILGICDLFMQNRPCNIICNFTMSIFIAACMAKRKSPQDIKLFAVIHSDDENYYYNYSAMEKYIDKCFVISSRIKEKLINKGFPVQKISMLNWEVECDVSMKRSYASADFVFKIGYAGRITKVAKRVDLLSDLIVELADRNIEWEIAGEGDYLEEFKKIISSSGVDNKVVFCGYLPNSMMPDFWRRQDVMVSCSDWEGHSISQVEAMANGAVPVITDTSGARDDVSSGVNGYVLPLGDVEAIKKAILNLYLDRVLLKQMGQCAHKSVCKKNSKEKIIDMWKCELL